MFQKPPADIALSKNEQMENNHNSDDVETVVGPSVVVEGDFASEGNIVVKGTVSGSVKTSKLLTVEKGARILANVRAGGAKVSGSIKGNVKVGDRLELFETAQVMGDMECKTLVIMAGALVQGKVNMKGLEIAEEKKDEKKIISRFRAKVEETGEIL